MKILILLILLYCSKLALSSQIEAPLMDSVKTALTAAYHNIGPPEPVHLKHDERLNYARWLIEISERLKSRMPDLKIRIEFLQTVWYESHRAGLDVSLVLGLIQVESGFRKHAISKSGARGFMQIMPFWMNLIGDGDTSKLFHLQTNIRFGCIILRHYLDMEKGNLFMALGRYNGSRGKPQYPNAVLKNKKKWEFS